MTTIVTGDHIWGTTDFLVDPVLGRGTHQTIQAAITAASSGKNVFVRAGTYTEDITHKDGVNVFAYDSDARYGTTEIIGKNSISSGVVMISGIKLTTNSDYFTETTGSGSIELRECFLTAADNDGMNQTSTGSTACRNCQGDIETTGIKLFDVTAGGLSFRYCNTSNSGSSTTASTISAGSVTLQMSEISTIFSTSGAGAISLRDSRVSNVAINSTSITTVGTGTSNINNSILESGTASVLSIGSGTTIKANLSSFDSSNPDVITGAGTFSHSNCSLTGSSIAINPTTSNPIASLPGKISFDDGANYLQYYAEGSWTPTIDGSTGSPTVGYTFNTGSYTRIGNKVFIKGTINISSISGGSGSMRINGMPFTSANDSTINMGTFQCNGIAFPASTTYALFGVNANSTNASVYTIVDNAAGSAIQVSGLTATDSMVFSATYRV